MARARYQIDPEDGTIYTDDMTTALQVARQIRRNANGAAANGHPPRRGRGGRDAVQGDAKKVRQEAFRQRFLPAIKKLVGGHMLTSDTLAKEMAVQPKGLASFTKHAKTLLSPHGLKVADVVMLKRGPNGKHWHGGAKLPQAIEALEKIG